MVDFLPEEMWLGGSKNANGSPAANNFSENKNSNGAAKTPEIIAAEGKKEAPPERKERQPDEVAAKSRFFVIFQDEFKNLGKKIKKIFQFKKSEPAAGISQGALKTLKPGGIEVTLMPAEAPLISRMIYEKIFFMIMILILAGAAVFIGWLWITWKCEVELGKISRVRTEMIAAESQAERYQNLIAEVRNLEFKASRVNDLLNHHIYWTKFFKLLETYTIPDVYYGDFNAEVGSKIILPTFGRNLVAAARQLIAFSNAPGFIQKATVTDLTGGTKGVNFNTNLILSPEALSK